jgi:hypothetical protein
VNSFVHRSYTLTRQSQTPPEISHLSLSSLPHLAAEIPLTPILVSSVYFPSTLVKVTFLPLTNLSSEPDPRSLPWQICYSLHGNARIHEIVDCDVLGVGPGRSTASGEDAETVDIVDTTFR